MTQIHADRILTERWADLVEEDDEQEEQQEQQAQNAEVDTNPPSVDTEEWEVQGRKKKLRQIITQRPLLLFASLPFDKKLLFRGIVQGQDKMLQKVARSGFTRFHAYDPISHQWIWKRKPEDTVVGLQRASDKYVQLVEKVYRAEIEQIVKNA
jgi:hypothetical protein